MSQLNDLEAKLEPIFTKQLPSLPTNVKDLIVQYGPYLAAVSLVLSAPALLAALGLGAALSPMMMWAGPGVYGGFSISVIFLIITLVLEGMALPGLFKRQLSAWRLMLYSSYVSALSSLFSSNLVGAILGLGISLYFMFQIKSYYK